MRKEASSLQRAIGLSAALMVGVGAEGCVPPAAQMRPDKHAAAASKDVGLEGKKETKCAELQRHADVFLTLAQKETLTTEEIEQITAALSAIKDSLGAKREKKLDAKKEERAITTGLLLANGEFENSPLAMSLQLKNREFFILISMLRTGILNEIRAERSFKKLELGDDLPQLIKKYRDALPAEPSLKNPQ